MFRCWWKGAKGHSQLERRSFMLVSVVSSRDPIHPIHLMSSKMEQRKPSSPLFTLHSSSNHTTSLGGMLLLTNTVPTQFSTKSRADRRKRIARGACILCAGPSAVQSIQNKETVQNNVFNGYAFPVFGCTALIPRPNWTPIGENDPQEESGSFELACLP